MSSSASDVCIIDDASSAGQEQDFDVDPPRESSGSSYSYHSSFVGEEEVSTPSTHREVVRVSVATATDDVLPQEAVDGSLANRLEDLAQRITSSSSPLHTTRHVAASTWSPPPTQWREHWAAKRLALKRARSTSAEEASQVYGGATCKAEVHQPVWMDALSTQLSAVEAALQSVPHKMDGGGIKHEAISLFPAAVILTRSNHPQSAATSALVQPTKPQKQAVLRGAGKGSCSTTTTNNLDHVAAEMMDRAATSTAITALYEEMHSNLVNHLRLLSIIFARDAGAVDVQENLQVLEDVAERLSALRVQAQALASFNHVREDHPSALEASTSSSMVAGNPPHPWGPAGLAYIQSLERKVAEASRAESVMGEKVKAAQQSIVGWMEKCRALGERLEQEEDGMVKKDVLKQIYTNQKEHLCAVVRRFGWTVLESSNQQLVLQHALNPSLRRTVVMGEALDDGIAMALARDVLSTAEILPTPPITTHVAAQLETKEEAGPPADVQAEVVKDAAPQEEEDAATEGDESAPEEDAEEEHVGEVQAEELEKDGDEDDDDDASTTDTEEDDEAFSNPFAQPECV